MRVKGEGEEGRKHPVHWRGTLARDFKLCGTAYHGQGQVRIEKNDDVICAKQP